eukprot:11235467-Karenia_brevis.AAC.1
MAGGGRQIQGPCTTKTIIITTQGPIFTNHGKGPSMLHKFNMLGHNIGIALIVGPFITTWSKGAAELGDVLGGIHTSLFKLQ